MTLKEEQLSADVRAGRLARVYYLFGKEPFLVKTYFDRIIKKAAGDDPIDLNLIQISGNPDPESFSDYIDGLPVFAEKKVVAINDIDPEKMEPEEFSRFIDIVSDVPDTTVLLFGITGFQPDEKKAKTKKLIAAADKAGVVCRLDQMQNSKIAELIIKKAARQGVVISRADAEYLTQRTLGNMTLVSGETAKLISYAGSGGTIDRAMIDSLVAKQLDTSVYELATAINAGKRAEAFQIIDDLMFERVEPIAVLSALSGAYLDLYRAKLAKAAGVIPAQAAAQFGYAKNREWVISRSMGAVSRLTAGFLREAVDILFSADTAAKSTTVEPRTILETAVTKLFTLSGR